MIWSELTFLPYYSTHIHLFTQLFQVIMANCFKTPHYNVNLSRTTFGQFLPINPHYFYMIIIHNIKHETTAILSILIKEPILLLPVLPSSQHGQILPDPIKHVFVDCITSTSFRTDKH